MKIRVEPERVRKRADFFVAEGARLCATDRFRANGFELTRAFAEYTAEAYFLVSDAYKDARQEPGHYTLPPKIAAITTLAVATINPLRPKVPPAAPTTLTLFANPVFGMRLAENVVGNDFHKCAWAHRKGFYDQLRNVSLPCLARYISSVRRKERKIGDEYELDLTSEDLQLVENRILLFTPA